jgi:hypothetical protein
MSTHLRIKANIETLIAVYLLLPSYYQSGVILISDLLDVNGILIKLIIL